MSSLSHREFIDLLLTHNLRCQIVDFLYNMDKYFTNLEHIKNPNYDDSLLAVCALALHTLPV